MTKKKYIEKLERELKYEVSGKMMLKEHISELEKKIQRLEGELAVAQIERAILKEQYIGRAESHYEFWHNCGAIKDNGEEEKE